MVKVLLALLPTRSSYAICFPYKQPPDCPVSISDAILPLIELHEVSVSLFIQPVQVPSNGSPAIEKVLNVWCSQTY